MAELMGQPGPYPVPKLELDDVAQVAADLERRVEELDRERAKLEQHRNELTAAIEDASRRRDALAAAREALGGHDRPTLAERGPRYG